MKEPPVRELQGMNPHVLHLLRARPRCISYPQVQRDHAVCHTCVYSPSYLEDHCSSQNRHLFFVVFCFVETRPVPQHWKHRVRKFKYNSLDQRFFGFFSSLNERLVQNAKGAVLAVENLSHEWKRCSVSLRLPQSPSRRRRHTGP